MVGALFDVLLFAGLLVRNGGTFAISNSNNKIGKPAGWLRLFGDFGRRDEARQGTNGYGIRKDVAILSTVMQPRCETEKEGGANKLEEQDEAYEQ